MTRMNDKWYAPDLETWVAPEFSFKPAPIMVTENMVPLVTRADGAAHEALGGYFIALHPNQYLDLMCELHGGFPRALARWERRILRERAIPKPRLP
jgi:hypothetical protein